MGHHEGGHAADQHRPLDPEVQDARPLDQKLPERRVEDGRGRDEGRSEQEKGGIAQGHSGALLTRRMR